jgi:hypothetical protein
MTQFTATRIVQASPGRTFEAFTTTFRFTPENGGTRVDLELVVEPITTFAKLVSPLGKLMLGACMKQFEGDLDDMTAVAEGRSAVSTAPAGA